MQDSDSELLRAYAEHGSEVAFAELVSRHINLVYSAALRQVNDAHLAQDVTQAVFFALACKAGKMRQTFVPGWLYRSACFESAKLKRAAVRRQARERQVLEMQSSTAQSDPDWDALAPMLDEAMSQLGEKDRDALLIRYCQNRDLKAVGARIGASEDAAQKRVARALEKLRELLARRGLTLSAAALATALASQAVNAAPPGLAANVTASALAGATAGATAISSLIELITTPKFQAASISTLFLAAVVGLLLQNQVLHRLREERVSLREQLAQLDSLRAENAQLGKLRMGAKELERLRKEHLDLLRLRNEVARLRKQLQEQRVALAPTPSPESVLTNLPPVQLTIEAKFVEALPAVFNDLGWGTLVQASKQGAATGILTEQQSAALFRVLKETAGVDILSAPKVTTLDRRQAQIRAVDLRTIRTGAGELEPQEVGPMLDVLPVVAADHATVELTAIAAIKQFLGYTETEPAQPVFRNFSATAHAVLRDGQTLVLTGPRKQSVGELPPDAKQIFVLVTPTLIDPAGNRLHVHDDEQPELTTVPPQP
jgi:RNA polymerase sigma factor (sigma-70 family)